MEEAGAYSVLVHACGPKVGSGHLLPTGQAVHVFAPSNAENVPNSQRIGNAVEVAHAKPFGHKSHVVFPATG